MTDDDYDEGEHNKEVYAHFGLAFYMAQCLEQEIRLALLHGDFLSKQHEQIRKTELKGFDRKKYETEFDAFFDDQFLQTMGNLMKRLSKYVSLDAQLRADIEFAKKKRDYLSHHFFRDNSEKFMNRSGKDQMISDLEGMRNFFAKVDRDLHKATQPLRKRLGIKDEKVA